MKKLIILLSCFTFMSCFKNTNLEKQEMLKTLKSNFFYEMDPSEISSKFSELNIIHSFIPKERIPRVMLSKKVNDNYEHYKGRYVGSYRTVQDPRELAISISIDLGHDNDILEINFQEVRRY